MNATQTDFWTVVGRPAGLERGLEGSTAKPTTAKQYSAALALNRTLEPPAPPAPTLTDRATGRARQMQAQYRAELDAFARLIEQARTDALAGRRAREHQSRALATLRDQVNELQGAKAEAAHISSESRELALELDRQKKCLDEQQAAMKVLLEQAAAKTSAMLSEAGFWKREVEAARAQAAELRELLCPTIEPEVTPAQSAT